MKLPRQQVREVAVAIGRQVEAVDEVTLVRGARRVRAEVGYFPPATNFVRWRLFHFPEPESLEFLRRFGVDTVVVSAADGARPEWARESAEWAFVGPFPGGDAVLRLSRAGPPGFAAAPAAPAGPERLDPSTWRVAATYPRAGLARDGRDDTAWSTVDSAHKGDYYSVRSPSRRRWRASRSTFRPPSSSPRDSRRSGERPTARP